MTDGTRYDTPPQRPSACPDCNGRMWVRAGHASVACACIVQRVAQLERKLAESEARHDA